MNLYTIIKELQNASGSNAKTAILEANKDNELLKAYLKAVYDPSLSYYQTKILKGVQQGFRVEFSEGIIEGLVYHLAERNITGNQAEMWLSNQYSFLDTEGQELLELLIKRSIGAGVGDTMILKVFPDLYFIPPYQRCSLMDAKVKDRFTKLDSFVVQRKEDGSFCYLVKEVGKAPEAITRAGSKYPTEFVEKLARGLPDGYVIIGELLVEEDGVELDRKTGNGILNSVLKGGDCSPDLSFKLSAWDCITPEEFKIGKSNQPYSQRFSDLDWVWEHIVPTKYVKTLKEAYAIYSKFTAEGKEGAILKTTDFKWASGTSEMILSLSVRMK